MVIKFLITAKWRLRIKMAEQLHHKPQTETLSQLSKAKSFFEAGDYESAVNLFTEIHTSSHDLKALSNRSACWLKLNNARECIADCTQCLNQIETEIQILTVEIKGDDGMGKQRNELKVKMYARRALGYSMLREIENAIADLEMAISMDGDNQQLHDDLLNLRRQVAE